MIEYEAYPFYTVCEQFGLSKNEAQTLVENDFRDFPFKVIKVGKNYLVPRKQVDDFLEYGKKPLDTSRLGRKRKWFPGEFIFYRFQVPNQLNKQFERVIESINRELPSALNKADFQRIAIIEFIQRRPEFLNNEKNF